MSIQKKVVALGDSGVGKTCLLYRYLYEKFDNTSMATIGANFKTKVIALP